MEEDKYFSVKYYGIDNPLKITLPPNERKKSLQYIEVEVGAFFWTKTQEQQLSLIDIAIPMKPIFIKIPGLSSGNYDINGHNTDLAVIVAPAQKSFTYQNTSCRYSQEYTYSPGRPDLYLCPPSPVLTIQFLDDMGNLIIFRDGANNPNPYYLSLNISM